MRNLFIILLSWFVVSHATAQTLPPCESQVSPKLCQKIGQMLIVGFGGLKEEGGKVTWQDPNSAAFTENSLIAKDIKDHHIGGVILFERPFYSSVTGQFLKDRNIQNPNQVRQLIDNLQAYAKKQDKSAPPLLITVDQEGGMVYRLPYYRGFKQKYPIPQAFGANEELAKNEQSKKAAFAKTYQIVSDMGSELAQLHFNVDFSPSVDLNINPLNPIIGAMGRSFSANPRVVTNQAIMFIRAFREKGIIPVLKHFPGHGSSTLDSHENLVDVTNTYHMSELQPYKDLIQKGYNGIIMTTHVINGNFDKSQCKTGPKNDPKTWCPATMSAATINNLLRKQLGFKGVIVSDDMMMGAIAKQYSVEEALTKAINAGVDMFILSNNDNYNTPIFVSTIAKLIKEGKIKESQIDAAYDRILKLKDKVTVTD